MPISRTTRWAALGAVSSLLLLACASRLVNGQSVAALGPEPLAARPQSDADLDQMAKRTYDKPSDAELRERLTPRQYDVTQNDATEPPFKNELHDNKAAGLYVDVATGEPLFTSLDKFDSGSGWPSFTKPIHADHIESKSDYALGMKRVEVRSRDGDSHLGHVFDDGPGPDGLRYCINSASMRFISVAALEAEGYGEYAKLFATEPTETETAVLAGGCFWGMEELIRDIPGVIDTEVGYAGGTSASPTYNDVKTGTTGHAESVRIVFDPKKLSYDELLENWFFRMHDPTTANRQGNDVGTQYRSAIFVFSPEQRKVAAAVKERVGESGKWDAPIVTEIVDAGPFTAAEGYHQDYLENMPDGYTCHFMRD